MMCLCVAEYSSNDSVNFSLGSLDVLIINAVGVFCSKPFCDWRARSIGVWRMEVKLMVRIESEK